MTFFGNVRQKIFDGKSWYSLPPLIHKLFRYRTFSETQIRRVPLRNFSALWDKKLLTKNRDTPPPLLYINFFDTRNFLKQRRVHLRSFSVMWENKFSIENRDLPLIGINVFATRNSLKHRRVLDEIFRHCETKKIQQKIVT